MSDIHATIGQKSGDQDDQDDQDDHELMLNRRKEGSGVTIKLRGGCQKKPSSFNNNNNNNNNNKGTTTSKAKQGLAARTYIHFIVSGAFHDNKFTLYKPAEYIEQSSFLILLTLLYFHKFRDIGSRGI